MQSLLVRLVLLNEEAAGPTKQSMLQHTLKLAMLMTLQDLLEPCMTGTKIAARKHSLLARLAVRKRLIQGALSQESPVQGHPGAKERRLQVLDASALQPG